MEDLMNQRGIDAYDLPQRVASYDANMDVMHPNRPKMVHIALEVLPFPKESRLKALDLGIGTGYFTKRFLECYPHSTVIAVDGAKAMTDLARTRLNDLADKIDFRVADFRRLDQLALRAGEFDLVYSSYALHHLNREEKHDVVAQSISLLHVGGWFLNADLVVADSPQIEERIQQLRVQGILDRANREDARFRDAIAIRAFLDAIEQQDGDQPQTLAADLQILRDAGVRGASVFWLEYREAVVGGQR
jgi:tRNA (cmo5U34)-methyltransferase